MKLVSGIEVPSCEYEADFILQQQHPCHYACKEGNLALLNNVVNQPFPHSMFKEDGVNGWNPAHWAVYFKKHQALLFLHKYSSSLIYSKTMHYSQSPLHLAAGVGDHEAVNWLLSQGSDPNAKDSLGETPLHKAARNGSESCLSLLLVARADTGVLNNNGQDAWTLASMCGFFPAATLLHNAHQEQVGVKRKLELEQLETDVQVKRFCMEKENVSFVQEVVTVLAKPVDDMTEAVDMVVSTESQTKVVENSVDWSDVSDNGEPVMKDTEFLSYTQVKNEPNLSSHYRTYESNRYGSYNSNRLSMGHFF